MVRIKTHPGSVLREELIARGLNANRLALAIRVPSKWHQGRSGYPAFHDDRAPGGHLSIGRKAMFLKDGKVFPSPSF